MKVCRACSARFSRPGWNCPECGFRPEESAGIVLCATHAVAPTEAFDPLFFPQLAALEADSFWFRARNELILWSLRRHFSAMKSFAEIGCGTGFVLQAVRHAFPEVQLAAGEIYLSALAFARSRVPGANFALMDATDIPYIEEFDAMGAFDVIEHADDDLAILRACHRALKPGGGLVLTVPQHPQLWSETDAAAKHRRRYTREEVAGKLQTAGFQIIGATSFVTILLPVMYAARLLRRAGTAQTEAELKIPRVLNRAFELVMSIELMLIRTGVSLPFGGSLLVVASKR